MLYRLSLARLYISRLSLCRLLLMAALCCGHNALADADSEPLPAPTAVAGAADAAEPPQTGPAPAVPTSPAVGSGVISTDPLVVVVGLMFVVAMIFVVAWLLRRLTSVSMVGGQVIKIVSALPVGPREKILLVDIAGQQLLLGVAPGRVSHLQSFDQPVVANKAANKAAVNASGPGEFATKLKQLLHGSDNNAVNKG